MSNAASLVKCKLSERCGVTSAYCRCNSMQSKAICFDPVHLIRKQQSLNKLAAVHFFCCARHFCMAVMAHKESLNWMVRIMNSTKAIRDDIQCCSKIHRQMVPTDKLHTEALALTLVARPLRSTLFSQSVASVCSAVWVWAWLPDWHWSAALADISALNSSKAMKRTQ